MTACSPKTDRTPACSALPPSRMKSVGLWTTSRPFCRGFCPLGAFYGLTARFALLKIGVDKQQCIDCGECRHACPVELDVPNEVGGPECIACGDCISPCPQGGIKRRFGLR
jgi:polyferredoxin